MRSACTLLLLAISYWLLALLINPQQVSAQTPNTTSTTTSTTSSYAAPNMDPDVPRNQHTYAQAVTIEVLSAVMCQLTGIDPVDPGSPCLGINPKTQRLGYAPLPQRPDNSPQIGGLVGTATDMIASTYRPVVTTGVYTEYLADNFGIVKKAHAAETSYGFNGLKPIFALWVSVRNLAYALLVFAFTFIGIGIMLRVKIDPRTVMTIQNQIPKVIIAIILITFSYAISAILVDLMWVTTYAGVNMIAKSAPSSDLGAGKKDETLSVKGTRQLLEIPLVYVNNVFHTSQADGDNSGILHITNQVSNFIGDMIYDIVRSILGIDKADSGCVRTSRFLGIGPKITPHIDLGQCIADVFGFLAKVVANIIIFVSLILALFKIWFNLLKAYVFSLFYIILSPVFIVFGLLPTKPLGFENWLRRFFSNIAIFPITAFIIVAARLLMDVYERAGPTDPQFIPPLIGHNAGANFGALLAFGAILIAPSIQTILREKMGVKQIGTPGIVAAGFAGGAAVIGAPVGRAMKHLNRYDARTGDIGALAKLKRGTGEGAIGIFAKMGSKHAEKALAERKSLRDYGDVRHTSEAAETRTTERGARGAYKDRFTYRERRQLEKELKKLKKRGS